MSAYPAKLEAALSLLSATGMRPSQYAPPLHRLVWRFGWYVPPPHLATFAVNLMFLGAWFGFVWGAVMSVAVWSRQGMPIIAQLAAAVFAGVLFGFLMAHHYQRAARKHQLPPWSQFEAQHG